MFQAFGWPLATFIVIKLLTLKSFIMEKKKIVLSFKEETTPSGNVQKVANIKANLQRLSDKEFTYTNASGETLTYKLATISFVDTKGTTHVRDGVVVYDTSYNQGMEAGYTYLGKISRSNNADGTPRKPWYTISSLLVADENSDADFEDVEVSEEIGI